MPPRRAEVPLSAALHAADILFNHADDTPLPGDYEDARNIRCAMRACIALYEAYRKAGGRAHVEAHIARCRAALKRAKI